MIYKRNFQKLAIEMFNVNNGLSVQLFSENFHFAENHYSFRHQSGTKLKVDHVKTETYGKQSVTQNLKFHTARNKKNVKTLTAFKTLETYLFM